MLKNGSLTNLVTETDNIDCRLSSLLIINGENNRASIFAVDSTGFVRKPKNDKKWVVS